MDGAIGESKNASYSEDTLQDTANFECHICFELAQDPIVTLCGHLYCWPCLYQWLRHHSHSRECPVCKAIVIEDKLVPIYGRGKSIHDPRTRLLQGITVPNRPSGQRPRTAPRANVNYARANDWDSTGGFMPVAAARFGHMTLSAIFGALPAIFNLQASGFHDATVYGTTSGVLYMFSSSFHGGYIHGFHHYHSPAAVDWKPIALKFALIFMGTVVLLRLLFA